MGTLAGRVLLATEGSEDTALAALIAADLSARARAPGCTSSTCWNPCPATVIPGVTVDEYFHVLDEMREEAP
jgi:hypothetical protein